MTPKQISKYKDQLSAKNKDYARNSAYYLGANPTILQDKNTDEYGNTKKQDRRIPLPIARKLINTVVGFQFADVIYSETGNSLSNDMTFNNLVSLNNQKIDTKDRTEYGKFLDSIIDYNDNDILTLETAIECCNHGRGYKIYYFADSMLRCDTIPANQILPVYTDDLNPALEKALWYRSKEAVSDKGEPVKTYMLSIYTAAGFDYYEWSKEDCSDTKLIKEKSMVYDLTNKIPQMVHVIEFNIFRDKKNLIGHAYGMIDEADRVISKNMSEELAGARAAILRTSMNLDNIERDAQGKTQMDRFMDTNIAQNMFPEDTMEWIVKNIQDSFVFGVYDRLTKDIFSLTDIPNFSDGEEWGNTISGVSAAYRLLGFTYLCNQIFRVFSEGLRAEVDLINAYTDLLANNGEVKRTMNYIDITANRELPKNLLENATIAATLKGILSKQTLYKLFPELVSNPLEEQEASDKEERDSVNALMGAVEEPIEETEPEVVE